MKIDQATPAFRPVTIVIETQDELDKLWAVIEAVSLNVINHSPQTIAAAKELGRLLNHIGT